MSRSSTAASLLAGLALTVVLGGAAAAGSDDAAHSLAEKFARDAQPAKRAKPSTPQARKEPAASEAVEGERRRAAQLKADEEEMLARARADAEEARRAALEQAQRETHGSAKVEPAAPEPDDIGAAPRETTEELEARRQAEADAVSEKLRRARESLAAAKAAEPRVHEPEAPARAADETEETATAPATAVVAVPKPAVQEEANTPSARVTVLLAIDHGKKGIRRFDATGDPILCVDDDCFVGAGADRAAKRLPRRSALGVGNTFGKRAGACSHSLTCVLRDVDLGAYPRVLRPVDLRVLHHDRRDPVQVKGDSDCRVGSGQLSCRFAVRGRDWRAWIVPEALAASAGPALLRSALDDGLGATRTLAARR